MSTRELLHKYWIKLENAPVGFGLGAGVTAFTEQDALDLLRTECFQGGETPKILSVKVDVTFSDLDQGHVVPNMHPMSERGVWFPMTRTFA